jgi:hypothetical protein
MSNLETYKKAMRKSNIIDSKRTSLMGLFLWDMRSRPKKCRFGHLRRKSFQVDKINTACLQATFPSPKNGLFLILGYEPLIFDLDHT